MTHDVEQSDGAASARPAKRQKTMAPTSPPPPIMCCVCREPLKEQEVGFSCPHCRFGIFCRDCLRGWFLKATVDETRMPVKCCGTDVPVKKLKGLLTVEETKLYEAKYDEWSTFDKFYCPVPTCSAFIPSKLYLYHSSDKLNPVTATTKKKKHVSCPACHLVLCTTCRGEAHSLNGGKECTKERNGFDPKLEAKLKKWGIKRCPKCNAGVRLMYGCPHIRCRCSFNFCFGCLRAIEDCEGRCGDGYSPDEASSEEGDAHEEDDAPTTARGETDLDPDEDGDFEELARIRALSVRRLNPVSFNAPPRMIQAKPEDKTGNKEDSDVDLDDGVGSDLDLGSDPDEPPEWQCRHNSWTKVNVEREGWPDPAICNWCNTSGPERVRQDEASKAPKEATPFKNTISEITNPAPPAHHSMMVCLHCGIRMCLTCAKALHVV